MFHQIMEILFFKMEKSVYFYIYCVGKKSFSAWKCLHCVSCEFFYIFVTTFIDLFSFVDYNRGIK